MRATTTRRPAKSEFIPQLIRSAGVKVTRGRVRILELLQAAKQPLSHVEIEAVLVEDPETSVDRVTVYRILDSLVDSGLALKAVDTRGIFRYSSAGTQHLHQHHIHFRCVDCAGMFCLDVPPPIPPKLPQGFQLLDVSFDVRGTCARCTTARS